MKFEFDEENHLYTLDGRPLTGVTTVLSMIAKPALIQWAANQAVEYIASHIKEILTIPLDKEKIAEVLKGAKSAHRIKKEDAGTKGTDIHAIIEKWIKAKIAGEETFSEHEEKQVQHFINWAVDNKVKFLESEKRLYSTNLWIAGTADFVCEIGGKKFIGDIKTGGVYDRVPMAQCAAYRRMLEEMGEKDFVGSVVVNIKKDGKFNEEKDVYWSLDYDEDFRLFHGALEIYRVLNNTLIK